MRATIFNICVILSLFSVAIYATPLSARDNPDLPECPAHFPSGYGRGLVCNPRPSN